MDSFSEIFMPPESPNPDYNPRENVLKHIQDMDDAIEAEHRLAHTRHFMNQLNDAETGNISMAEEKGTTGGQVLPSSRNIDPANIQIVNEYNSFNLANVTHPITPKWKQI